MHSAYDLLLALMNDLFQIVLFTPGEIAADGYQGYLSNLTITGLYAQEINGAPILLERESTLCHCGH
jgi:hypothetical protein